MDVELQHIVFCTEFLDGWWSWEPLCRSCVQCGWCHAWHHLHRTHDLRSGSQDHHPSKNSVQKNICCNSTSNAPEDGRMNPKYIELGIHESNYLVASSWHFRLFHEEDVRSNNPRVVRSVNESYSKFVTLHTGNHIPKEFAYGMVGQSVKFSACRLHVSCCAEQPFGFQGSTGKWNEFVGSLSKNRSTKCHVGWGKCVNRASYLKSEFQWTIIMHVYIQKHTHTYIYTRTHKHRLEEQMVPHCCNTDGGRSNCKSYAIGGDKKQTSLYSHHEWKKAIIHCFITSVHKFVLI
jgi:hypothetical protein